MSARRRNGEPLGMARPSPPSSFLAGDPICLEPDIGSLEAVLARLGLSSLGGRNVRPLVPGILLIHTLTLAEGAPVLRWVKFPHAPVLGPGQPATVAAVVVTSSVAESSRALRVVARLAAALGTPGVIERALSATTRHELVDALDAEAGESVLTAADLVDLLASSPDGLGSGEVRRRLAICGLNRFDPAARAPVALRLLRQMSSFFAVLLWVGGALAFLAGLPQLGWTIFAVVVINGIFSFLQEYRAERAVERLQELLPHEIAVIRDGGERRVAATELVPGDLVCIEEGDQVPADGQLLTASGLRVDESALTGEAHAVSKLPASPNERARVPRAERHELLFAGTAAVAGSGRCLVTATGMATEIGHIAALTQRLVEEPSPLQREMTRVTRIVTVLAVAFGGVFAALGVLSATLSPPDALVFGLGVIVANVPEGLLPTLTLALALGVQRLVRRNVIVKRLSAVEALGATTVICTDKTGTLTQNAMVTRYITVADRTRPATEALGHADARALLEAAVLASQATARRGDPTEVALVAMGIAAGVDPTTLRERYPVVAPYPFDSFRKRMTLVRRDGDVAVAYVKGAPAETLRLCTTARDEGGVRALTPERRRTILAEQDRMAAEGLRILAVAVRPLPPALLGAAATEVERDLTFLGLIALWDPPRPEVQEAVALCRRAGIRIVMITGDYGLTARAIARHVGLPVETVVTGEEVERLPPGRLRELLRQPGILFARTSPVHKLAIVSALRAEGEVVAVTGDGVNDAPALKAADIGVAMGRRGSDVAKEAAQVVVTDDNFASIVAAIRHGRAIYANMGKFVTYIFASNVPELVPFLATVFLGIPLPLTVMQILAVDLGTDLVPALALGAEPPEPAVMDQPPRARDERLLSGARLLRAYGFLGLVEAALALAGFFWVYWLAGWRPGAPMAAEGELYRRATTMTLAGIVAAQVGNVFACRTERESVLRQGFFGNPLVFAGIATEIAILLGLIVLPGLRDAFALAPLSFSEWSPLLAFPVTLLLLDELRKWLVRLGRRRQRS